MSSSSDSGVVLLQRVRRNRMVLGHSRRQMVALRSQLCAAREEGRRLRGEVQQRFDTLTEGLALAGSWTRPARGRGWGAASTVRRVDDLDEVRRQLHENYAATGDPAARAELLASYDGFARSLALRYRHRESVDDLVQVARIGLLHAIDRFDPSRGRPFPLFARLTITGELKRHLRDRTWGMRVPRALQEDYLAVMAAVDELTADQGASPTMEMLAARCEMSMERVLEALELRANQRALSLDAPPGAGSDDPLIEVGHEDLGFGQLEHRQLLAELLGRLPQRDRRILELRYFQDMTQSEIAAHVGVSQMCVSRVLARTLGRLRIWARTAVA